MRARAIFTNMYTGRQPGERTDEPVKVQQSPHKFGAQICIYDLIDTSPRELHNPRSARHDGLVDDDDRGHAALDSWLATMYWTGIPLVASCEFRV